jgi:hypothetical protein
MFYNSSTAARKRANKPRGNKMTANQSQAQENLNKAYFAMEKNPGNQVLADAYWAARDALCAALMTQSN